MKILKKNLKGGEVSVSLDSADDLWHLSQIIAAGDFAKGKTERKIKLGSADGKQAVVKKTVFMEVEVEKIDFSRTQNSLRLNGKVTEGPEDVPRGSYHTIDVDIGSSVTIRKEHWPSYQLDKLKEAAESVKRKILIVLFDREEAIFAQLKGHGYEILTNLKGDVSKKRFDNVEKKNFYSDISKTLEDYDKRLHLDSIIVASPSFWKEYLMKEVPDTLKKKIVLTKASEVDEGSIQEIMRSPELAKVLESERSAKELSMAEDLMAAISKDNACYGIKEVNEKIDGGAVKELFVSYEFLNESREKGNGRKVEGILKSCEESGGKVHVFSTDAAEKKLIGLGGIAGILRWKNY